MELHTSRQGTFTVIKVRGRLDTLSGPEFEKKLSECMDQGELTFIVDMEGLEYISSAGLRSILLVAKKLKSRKGSMAFCSLTPMVAKVFSLSNFTSIFALHDSLEAALASS
jgi:anti-sigma B factor antagonist